jgi:hypothetical protein
MKEQLFREGGPLNIRQTADDRYTMTVAIPTSPEGRVARACPKDDCSPGYFKVTLGTGITEGHSEAFCPYCREAAAPGNFITKEQLRYAEEHLLSEAEEGMGRIIKEALGLGFSNRRTIGKGGFLSMEISYKSGERQPIRRPLEDEVRRDVVCPHCGLDHSVYGLATWCADCGADIFLTHVDAELAVVTAMLGDVERRKELLGERVAAKDLENCLEDTVSIFEAVLRILVRRAMLKRGIVANEIEIILRKSGNCFQSIGRTVEFLGTCLNLSALPGLSDVDCEDLRAILEKRHPIAHNLGVVDRKYLDSAVAAFQEGREVNITSEEITRAITMCKSVFHALVGELVA